MPKYLAVHTQFDWQSFSTHRYTVEFSAENNEVALTKANNMMGDLQNLYKIEAVLY
jgi:hypothetical protein